MHDDICAGKGIHVSIDILDLKKSTSTSNERVIDI